MKQKIQNVGKFLRWTPWQVKLSMLVMGLGQLWLRADRQGVILLSLLRLDPYLFHHNRICRFYWLLYAGNQ